MPKKKEGKSKGKIEVEAGPEIDPFVLFRNYSKQCESVGISVNEAIKRALCFNENESSSSQLLIGEEPLGSCGCRALVAAILGKCNHEATKYTAFKEIRIWRSNLGDHGAMAMAQLLREAGPEFNLSLLELSDNNIGVQGAIALGRSLCAGMMKSLVNLNLDYNPLTNAGVAALERGLCSNSTLKKLSLRYCLIDECGGGALSEILSSPKITISTLDLTGNRLGGKGLVLLCPGLARNSKLQKLDLSDNNIMSTDIEGIKIFSSVIREHKSLTDINLLYNTLGVEGGLLLVEGIEGNKKIDSFTVDCPLISPDIYSALNRVANKGKGKKKKPKKKKKKK